MMRHATLLIVVVSMVLAASPGLFADTVPMVTVNGAGTTGPGLPFSLGYTFTVDDPLSVAALGRFDINGGGLATDALARLYNWDTGAALASATISAGSAGEPAGAYNAHYADLATPVALSPGTTYLAAVEVTGGDFIYDAPVTWAGGITYGSGKATQVNFPTMPATAGESTFPIDRDIAGASYLGPNLKITTDPPAPMPIQGVSFNSVGNTNTLEFITGWEFNTAEPIRVTHLGHVDMLNDGIASPADVGIWSVATGALLDSVAVLPTSPAETSGVGSTLYEPIAPLDLSPGNYIVAAQRNGENFYYDASHTTAPGITWVAGRAASIGPLPNPANAIDLANAFFISHGSGSYFGANFKFESGGPPSGLTLSAPTGRAVLQRDDANLAEVVVEGTFAGSATRIEARAVARAGYGGSGTDWQVIDAAPTGGTFSSNLTIPGGWYDVEVRAMHGQTEVGQDSVERVGVGEVFVMAGQSNAANFGAPAQSPDDDRVSALNLNTGQWQQGNDPQPYAGGSGGSPWPELGDLLAAEYDVPIGIISVAVGSTTVGQWQVGGHYARIEAALDALGPNGLRAILWHQGESDSLAGTSAAGYAQLLQNVIAQSRIDAGFDVPWGVALASWHPGSSAANEARIIAGQQMAIADDPLVFTGASTDDFHINGWLSDSVHFNQTGLDLHAERWLAQIVANQIVPEPSTFILALLGLIGVMFCATNLKDR